MNNSSFVSLAYEKMLNNEHVTKKHWSLLYENWILYSYWKHYPLMFKIWDSIVVNKHGYSNTTSKHIRLCSGFASIKIDLMCSRQSYYYRAVEPNRDNVISSLIAERESLLEKNTRAGSINDIIKRNRLEEIQESLNVI